MSNSNVPAYILEAKQKGETHVKVLRRVSYSPEREDFKEHVLPIAKAISVFSKPSNERNMQERRIKPLGYSTIGPVAPVVDASSLGTDAILAELAKRGVQIPSVIAEQKTEQVSEPQAAAPRRSRPPVQQSGEGIITDLQPGDGTIAPKTETINPEPTA